jgi:transposase
MKSEVPSGVTAEVSTTSAQSNEVVPKATRRRYTAEYKERILKELDACEHGQRGAVLRREGLYSTMIAKWRSAQHRALEPRKRGRKPDEDVELRKQIQGLEREKNRLERRLQQAEKIIEVQKKLSELLGLSSDDQLTSNA